jgi:hypothetical protein
MLKIQFVSGSKAVLAMSPRLLPHQDAFMRQNQADPASALAAYDSLEQDRIATWRRVTANIHRYGWHVAMNYGDDRSAPFAYSVGAASLGLPELIVAGIDPATGAQLINAVLARGRTEGLPEGVAMAGLANHPLILKALTSDQAQRWLPMADAHHQGRPFAAMQMVYPDPDGRFPWDPGYHFPWQPLLYGEPPA